MARRRINTACSSEGPGKTTAATYPSFDGITQELRQHFETYQQPDADNEQLYIDA